VRLFRNVMTSFATQVVGLPLFFVTSIILARFLSVEDRGLYGVAISFVSLLTLLAELGWGPATIYHIRRVGLPASRVVGAGLTFALAVSAVLVIACVPLQGWIVDRFMNGASTTIFRIVLVLIPVHMIWMLFSSVARGIDRFTLQNLAQVFVYAGRLIGMVLVLVVWPGTAVEALIAYVVVELLSAVYTAVGVLRETGLARPRPREVVEIQRFGLGSYLARIGLHLHERLDVLLIAYLLGDPSHVAHYAVAVGVIAQLKLIPEAVARALYPQLAGMPEERTGALAARVSRHSMLWVVLSAIAAGVAAPLLIPLVYGDAYQASVAPFLILLPGMAAFTRYRVLSNYFTSLGRQRVNVIIQVVTTSLNVVLNLLLIPQLGIVGAALASLVSYGLASLWITRAFASDSGVSLRETLILRADDLDTYRRRFGPWLRRLGLSAR
jgi:O-antigen/teichoic acid export membrane protein